MVVEREREIDNFIPEEYWDISTNCLAKTGKKEISFLARFV